MADPIRESSAPKALSPRWRINVLVLAVIAAVVLVYFAERVTRDRPVVYDDLELHFKYGSTGGERESGIPYWIWKVLPKMFPEYLPWKT